MNARRENSKVSNIVLVFFFLFFMGACRDGKQSGEGEQQQSLPYIGMHDVELVKEADGDFRTDSIYYTVPKFSFINQDSAVISHHDYLGKIAVVDFFFSNCPSICPMLSAQMVRVQESVKKEGLAANVKFLSHTVDPDRDTPARLKEYADLIGADLSNWNFVTGKAEDIYYQAETGYMLSAFPSDSAEGGFFHTDKIVLLDKQMHIRGLYDGTSTKSVDKLIADILVLNKEK
ncbi:MAG: SCO family protein [Flavobacteriales bacterium]|jgi:protein SCO1/2